LGLPLGHLAAQATSHHAACTAAGSPDAMPSALRSAAMGAPCCPHNRPAKQAHRPSLPNVRNE